MPATKKKPAKQAKKAAAPKPAPKVEAKAEAPAPAKPKKAAKAKAPTFALPACPRCDNRKDNVLRMGPKFKGIRYDSRRERWLCGACESAWRVAV